MLPRTVDVVQLIIKKHAIDLKKMEEIITYSIFTFFFNFFNF
jgi:hypothetical protein